MSDYGYVDAGKLADYANNQATGITANEIMRFPRADVQPVKRGRWVAQLNGHVICTFCGKEQKFSSDFCKHCGADMRDKQEEAKKRCTNCKWYTVIKDYLDEDLSICRRLVSMDYNEADLKVCCCCRHEFKEGEDNDLVQSCDTCNHYNTNTHWCSQYNDTTYSLNCSSYQVKEG